MKKVIRNIFLVMLCVSPVFAQEEQQKIDTESKLIFRAETAEESFYRAINYIKKLDWYKEHGYDVVLPQHEAFKELYTMSQQEINDSLRLHHDYWKQLFISEVYDARDYELSLEKLKNFDKDNICQALQKFVDLEKNWGFKIPACYEIIVTLYGPGGSYWPQGRILILPGAIDVLNSRWLVELIIHEMVHIGIEENIVRKYALEHWQKERLVDLICMLYLKNILSDYKPNSLNEKNGDRRIDTFVDLNAILYDLPTAIEKYKKSII